MTRFRNRLFLALIFSIYASAQQVSVTGSMSDGRYYHTSSLLSDGRVLVTGGWDNSSALATAELYDPSIQAFTLTGSMSIQRVEHTATLLSNGKLLIAGGLNANNVPLASAEIYDRSTGTFTSTGSLNVGRNLHSATLLANGTVLITGGMDEWGNILNSAELYDPGNGTFSLISSNMISSRKLHTATRLSNGTVLLAGGTSGWGTDTSVSSAEIYDPATGDFSSTGSLSTARSEHSAAPLPNGTVLITGGWAPDFSAVGISEIYDPASGSFTTTGSLGTARGDAIAATLQDGTVLVGGGWDTNFNTLTSLELYDPAAGTFSTTSPLHTERGLADASLLSNGSVLITGGLDNNSSALSSAELYQPAQSGPPLPNITSLSPSSGPVGTPVTITGTNFGATQQNSTVQFGGVAAQVTSWSDTSIVSSVPLGISIGQTTQVVVTTSNGSSNPSNFAVTACNVAPRSIGLLIGQSRTLSVSDGAGNPVTGITWATSDPTIASLTTDDPPRINAVAAGTATVYVCGLSVNVTVYTGTSLPVGAPIWSVPVGNGSGNISVVPAVPSDSGADVFALDNSGTLTAFSNDGVPVWKTAGIPGGSSAKVIPDFSGSAILKVPYSFVDSQGNAHITHAIKGIDPNTRQLVHLYTFSDRPANVSGFIDDGNPQALIPHPAGPLFVHDVATVHVLDPVAGAPIADVSLENSSWNNSTQGTQPAVTGDMIVAGDGNAYLPYVYFTENTTVTQTTPYESINDHTVARLMLLRVSPDGTYAKTELRNWTADHTEDNNAVISCSGAVPQLPFQVMKPITNADHGVAVFASAIFGQPLVGISPGDCGQLGGPVAPLPDNMEQVTFVANDSVTSQPNLSTQSFVPALQREDGSYIGTDLNNQLDAVNLDGTSTWQTKINPDADGNATAVKPLHATSDKGLIVTSSSTDTNGNIQLASLFTVDQSGNVTGQSADSGASVSWTGGWYVPASASVGSTITFLSLYSVKHAATYAAIAGGNPSAAAQTHPAGITYVPSLGAIYRHEVAQLAKGYVGNSTNWRETTGTTCNLFVRDVLTQASTNTLLPVPAPVRPNLKWYQSNWRHPFLAADWANPNLDGGCWKPLAAGPNEALPGDVIATGYPLNGTDGTGHVGIVVEPDAGLPNYIDASAADVAPYWWTAAQKQSFIPGTITLTDYGFRLPGFDPTDPQSNQGLKQDSTVRRFLCY